MSQNDTPTTRLPVGGMSLDDRLDRIETMCREILTKENATTTEVALIKSKLDLHDRILMGVCGTVGVVIVTAVVGLVIVKGSN